MTFCGGAETGTGTNHSDFSHDPVKVPDLGFLNPDSDHIHTAAVSSPLYLAGGSTNHVRGLCCHSTDFLLTSEISLAYESMKQM